jgi:5-methylcytosine-specific restriction endonuclease McrA
VVAACESCNRKKADKLLAEAKMTLRRQPFRPTYITVVLLGQAQEHEAWARYIPATV